LPIRKEASSAEFYAGKRVVVIGSGATAVTLTPAMAGKTAHITMLQRSPSYVLTMPDEDVIANFLNKVLGPKRASPIVRRKNILLARSLFKACRSLPRLMRWLLLALVRLQLPKHFDVDTHFSPRYNPWEERLCIVPNGDLFKAIGGGAVVIRWAWPSWSTDCPEQRSGISGRAVSGF